MAALAGACVLVGFTFLTDIRTRDATKASAGFAVSRNALAAEGRRNAEVLRAMGMRQRLAERWYDANRNYIAANEAASDIASGLGGMSKVFRMFFQSGVLAVGAYLVIHQEATAGIIIAGSILTSRALAPVEAAIANWKGFVAARQAGRRLDQLLTLLPQEEDRMALPAAERSSRSIGSTVVPPGAERPVLHDVSFSLASGEAVWGSSARADRANLRWRARLSGVWPQVHGKIRIDNAALDQWSPEALGRAHRLSAAGRRTVRRQYRNQYCPFRSGRDARCVLGGSARQQAFTTSSCRFPRYGTRIGEGGMALSAGQRQRIALARAFYGNPFLVVLDEPSSNLDSEGEEALTNAIMSVRRRGGIVIVITHRPKRSTPSTKFWSSAMGLSQAFGTKEEVLSKVLRNPPPPLRMAAR